MQRAQKIVPRMLHILSESKDIWPLATRWFDHLEKFYLSRIGLEDAEGVGMADSVSRSTCGCQVTKADEPLREIRYRTSYTILRLRPPTRLPVPRPSRQLPSWKMQRARILIARDLAPRLRFHNNGLMGRCTLTRTYPCHRHRRAPMTRYAHPYSNKACNINSHSPPCSTSH